MWVVFGLQHFSTEAIRFLDKSPTLLSQRGLVEKMHLMETYATVPLRFCRASQDMQRTLCWSSLCLLWFSHTFHKSLCSTWTLPWQCWQCLGNSFNVDFFCRLRHYPLIPVIAPLPKSVHDWLELVILHSSFRRGHAQIFTFKWGGFHAQDYLNLFSDSLRASFCKQKRAFTLTEELPGTSLE